MFSKFSMPLLVLLRLYGLMYIPLVNYSVRMLNCSNFFVPNELRPPYFFYDFPDVECKGTGYLSTLTYGWLGVLFYGAGIPLFQTLILLKLRRERRLNSDRVESITGVSSLFNAFSDERYYWGAVLYVRDGLFVATAIARPKNAVAFASMLLVISLCISLSSHPPPYASRLCNLLENVTVWTVLTVIIMASLYTETLKSCGEDCSAQYLNLLGSSSNGPLHGYDMKIRLMARFTATLVFFVVAGCFVAILIELRSIVWLSRLKRAVKLSDGVSEDLGKRALIREQREDTEREAAGGREDDRKEPERTAECARFFMPPWSQFCVTWDSEAKKAWVRTWLAARLASPHGLLALALDSFLAFYDARREKKTPMVTRSELVLRSTAAQLRTGSVRVRKDTLSLTTGAATVMQPAASEILSQCAQRRLVVAMIRCSDTVRAPPADVSRLSTV